MKLLYGVLFVALLLGLARAGTVTLTGGCSPVYNNSVYFNIGNSGNDTATNLLLIPHIVGLPPLNYTYSLTALPPGQNSSFRLPLENLSLYGSYVIYFEATYQQGVSAFTAVFPCTPENIKYNAISTIYIMPVVSYKNNVATVTVGLYNGGDNPVDVNASMILPPQLSMSSNYSELLNISPYQTKNATFIVKMPNSANTRYTAAIAAVYILKNIHYSTLSTIGINSAESSSISVVKILTWVVVAIVVAVIVVLMVRAMLHKKSKA